jgi:hypothetical protein
MTPIGVAAGVLALNAIFAAAGYCLLTPFLRGRTATCWLSYAGLALLLGAGASVVPLCWVAVAGGRTTPLAFVLTAVAVAAAGLVARALLPAPRMAPGDAPGWPRTLPGDLVATLSCFGVAVVSLFGLIGGLRSSPWLDDVWAFWVPKGELLDRVGLNTQVLVGGGGHPGMINPSYPFWWSIVTNLDLRFAGALDLRVVDFQESILVVAFVGAIARVLAGRVRPLILWPSLLAFVASPALFRQAQSGEADLPLACFTGVAVIAAVLWLLRRDSIALLTAGVAGSTAMSVKNEGFPLIAVSFAVLAACFVWPRPRAAALLAAVGAAAYATAWPWFHWRATHGAVYPISLQKLLSPSYLSARSSQGERSVQQVVHWTTTPHEWFPIVPLVILLSLVGLVLHRRRGWLLPPAVLVALGSMLVWVLWADPQDYVENSFVAYRVVTPIVLVAATGLPLLLESLVREGLPAGRLRFLLLPQIAEEREGNRRDHPHRRRQDVPDAEEGAGEEPVQERARQPGAE